MYSLEISCSPLPPIGAGEAKGLRWCQGVVVVEGSDWQWNGWQWEMCVKSSVCKNLTCWLAAVMGGSLGFFNGAQVNFSL